MSHSVLSSRLTRRTAVGASLLLFMAGLATVSQWASAADRPKGPEISRVIAKEMTAAQKAIQANQYAEAIKDLDGIENRPGLTPYDTKMIFYFRGIAYAKTNNAKGAQVAFEKTLATGAATPEEKSSITRSLFIISASTSQFQKAIDYGKEMNDAGATTPTDLSIIAQSYYQLKDCKDSILWADKAVAASKKAGEAPKENLYLFKLQCASDAGDTPGMTAALVELIRLTNKTSYWNNLIRIDRNDERDDHNMLMIYRVMYDTNSMTADTDYIEMAQFLNDAALPGEAVVVLNKASSTPGVLKDEHKERTTRLLAAMQIKADADKKGLPGFDAEGAKNPAGQLDVKTGEVYFGAGDYQNAVTAITRGLGKGQVKNLDEAYVYLGRSQANLKNTAEAKKAFAKLKDVPNISPRVLKLYDLYSEKLGSPQG